MATNSNSNVTLGSVFSGSTGVTAGSLGSTYVVSITPTITANQVRLTIANASGTTQNITINTGGGSGGSGNSVERAELQGTDLILFLADGTPISADLSGLIPNAMDANDFVIAAALDTDTNELTLTVQDQTPVSVDLSPLVQASPIRNDANRTYTQDDTTNQTRLTITGTQAVLTAIAPAPVPANAPPAPAAFNELVENTLSYDPPAVPAGGTLDSTNINSITLTDNQDSESQLTPPSPETDGSFSITTPAGTQQVDVDISYTTTDSNGNTETVNTNLITDAFVPYYTFTTAPNASSNASVPSYATTSSAALMSGTSFNITSTGSETYALNEFTKKWLVANQTGLAFTDSGFSVAHTELADTITIEGVTFYQYDFGPLPAGSFTATVV